MLHNNAAALGPEVILQDNAIVDMIVIGGATHGTLHHALLGGTAHRIVNRSPVPVLVVPSAPDGAGPDWVPIPG